MKINKIFTHKIFSVFVNRITIGLYLSAMLCNAQAAGLVVINSSPSFNFDNYEPSLVTGLQTSGIFGALNADTAGIFTATYLGNESGYTNFFTLSIDNQLLESNSIGDSISANVAGGLINFNFNDTDNSSFFANGQAQTSILGFVIMPGKTIGELGSFDYILGFNDSATSDADYDDFVVGVKFVAAAVPEPETYAMMMIGIAIVGFGTRLRRKNS